MNSESGHTSSLAAYVAGTSYEVLPGEVASRGKRVIFDTLGILLANSKLELGRIVTDLARQLGGKEESTVVGADFRTSCVNAALVNGTLGHGDEMDDTHSASRIHAAAMMVPTALAVAEREGASGKEFINAVVLGYDVACRLVLALGGPGGGELRQRNLHPTALCGGFGAAAAAGRLLRLSQEQMVYALALAASQASGLLGWMAESKHMAKAFQTGVAARNGVTAALLAKLGFEGPSATIEGPFNLFEAFSSGRNYDAVVEALGSRYEILRSCLKLYSAGYPIHAPLDALLQILKEQKLSAEEVAEIRVWMAAWAADNVDDRDMPSICLQNVLAVATYERKMQMEQSHSEELARDPRILDLRRRIKLIRDPELSQQLPPRRPCRVAVTTRDGREFTESREHAPGEPENPLSDQQVRDKFRQLADPVIGPGRAEELAAMVHELETIPDVRKLGKLLEVS